MWTPLDPRDGFREAVAILHAKLELGYLLLSMSRSHSVNQSPRGGAVGEGRSSLRAEDMFKDLNLNLSLQIMKMY